LKANPTQRVGFLSPKYLNDKEDRNNAAHGDRCRIELPLGATTAALMNENHGRQLGGNPCCGKPQGTLNNDVVGGGEGNRALSNIGGICSGRPSIAPLCRFLGLRGMSVNLNKIKK